MLGLDGGKLVLFYEVGGGGSLCVTRVGSHYPDLGGGSGRGCGGDGTSTVNSG